MKEFVTKHIKKHFELGDLFGDTEGKNLPPIARIQPASRSFTLFINILKLLPYLCLIGFGLSFWLGSFEVPPAFVIPLPFLPDPLVNVHELLLTVCVSGLIGYGTNFLAIKMLFKPVKRRPIWGQGLIPAQRERIIGHLAKGIHENILSEKLIKDRIHESGIITRLNQKIIGGASSLLRDENFRSEVKRFVHQYLSEYLGRENVREKVTEQIDLKLEEKIDSGMKAFLFKTYKRLNKEDYDNVLNNMIESVPDMAMEALEVLEKEIEEFTDILASKEKDIEEAVTHWVVELLEKIDIYELLRRQMQHFDEQRLEQMVWNATSEQLIYIQLLGTVLGILGGLLIWQPQLMLGIYLSIFATLFILDGVIVKFRKQ